MANSVKPIGAENQMQPDLSIDAGELAPIGAILDNLFKTTNEIHDQIGLGPVRDEQNLSSVKQDAGHDEGLQTDKELCSDEEVCSDDEMSCSTIDLSSEESDLESDLKVSFLRSFIPILE